LLVTSEWERSRREAKVTGERTKQGA